MYQRLNEHWPRMRPFSQEIYGKKIFLAGVENAHILECAYRAGVRDVLVSFYYLRTKNMTAIEASLARFDNVILDSGAFTLITNNKKKNKQHEITDEALKLYTEDFIRFADKYAYLFNFVIENDMSWKISPEYRKAALDEMRDKGIHTVPVIHWSIADKLEEYGFYDCELVAFAGDVAGGKAGANQVIANNLEKRGILIHGLAATDEGSINGMPYFSVDSTSWLQGGKYGITYVFTESKITSYEATDKAKRYQYKQKFIDAGLDWEGIEEDTNGKRNAKAVNTMNAYAWRQYAEYIRYNMAQSYWLTDEEKAEAKDKLAAQQNAKLDNSAKNEYEAQARRADLIRKNPVTSLLPEGSKHLDPRMVLSMSCNDCSAHRNCKAYKKDNMCYYDSIHTVNNVDDAANLIGQLLGAQHKRVAHAMLVEKLNGGNIDPSIGKEINTELKTAMVYGKLSEQASDVLPPPAANETGQGAITALFETVKEEDEMELPMYGPEKEGQTITIKPEPSDTPFRPQHHFS